MSSSRVYGGKSMYESRGYWEIQQNETEAKEEAARRKELRRRKNVAKATHSGTVVDKEGWTTVVVRGR